MSDDLRNRALLFWLKQFIITIRNDVTAQPDMCIIHVASDKFPYSNGKCCGAKVGGISVVSLAFKVTFHFSYLLNCKPSDWCSLN